MRVTPITITRVGQTTTYTADFIFNAPFGGKKARLLFWVKWFHSALTNPKRILQYGSMVRRRVWYTIPSHYAKQANPADAFFILALPLAIATGEDLIFDNPVSPEHMGKAKSIHTYYHEVVKRPSHIKVTVPKRTHNPSSKGTAQCFTLGLDSFYTLGYHKPKNEPKKKQLLYVDGYDLPFYQKRFLQNIHNKIKAVATATKTRPLFVKTNLRELSDAVIGWGRFHVSALVAVATLLNLQKLHISGESFDAPDWGLRLGVAELYTTKQTKITLVGHMVSREQKMKRLLKSSISSLFLRHLRVCWENVRSPHLPYNCSACQKCLKTQLNLLTLGVTHPPTFKPLDPDKIRQIQLVEHVHPEWQKVYQKLKQHKHDEAILDAVAHVLDKPLRR